MTGHSLRLLVPGHQASRMHPLLEATHRSCCLCRRRQCPEPYRAWPESALRRRGDLLLPVVIRCAFVGCLPVVLINSHKIFPGPNNHQEAYGIEFFAAVIGASHDRAWLTLKRVEARLV